MGTAYATIYGTKMPDKDEIIIDADFWPNVPAESNSGLVGLGGRNPKQFLDSLLFQVGSMRTKVKIVPIIDKSVPVEIAEKIAKSLSHINQYLEQKGWDAEKYCISFSKD